jgi:drug/metabolite transporter (DMT)-like permease
LLSSLLNVTAWMTAMGLALLWLPASEAVVVAYTMPVWASLLAWLFLGERMSPIRILALVMAFAGIAALMAGNGIEASTAKLPGIVMIVAGAFAFAIGTIASKRFPMALPLMTSSALQIGIGCVPVALAGLLFEHPRFEALSMAGWALMAYMTVIGYCVSYFSWFAALERLPASVATIGTMSVPVIGVSHPRWRCMSRSALARSQRSCSRWPASRWRRGHDRSENRPRAGPDIAARPGVARGHLCLCYVCWFAALERLPAATASIGTLLVPVVGVLAAGAMLHEPLGWREISALVFTLGGVALALRS